MILNEQKERALDIARETSYHLWESLLVINTLFITVVLGIVSFLAIKNDWVRFGMFMLIVLLLASSVLLVLNFRMTKDVYVYLSTFTTEDLDKEKEHIKRILQKHKEIKRNEDTALYLTAGVTLIFFLALFFLIPGIKNSLLFLLQVFE